eukprot:15417660-Heterocapsa_arctica.AAC.1
MLPGARYPGGLLSTGRASQLAGSRTPLQVLWGAVALEGCAASGRRPYPSRGCALHPAGWVRLLPTLGSLTRQSESRRTVRGKGPRPDCQQRCRVGAS